MESEDNLMPKVKDNSPRDYVRNNKSRRKLYLTAKKQKKKTKINFEHTQDEEDNAIRCYV